jgi:Tfp pilus assembly protein PilO
MSKQLFVFIIIVIALVSVSYFLAWPAFVSVYASQKENAFWQEKIAETQNLKQKLGDLAGKYEIVKEDAERILAAVPKEEDLPALLVQLEALSSQNGLILNSIAFKQEDATLKKGQPSIDLKIVNPAVASAAKKMGIHVALSGSPTAFRSFLKAVEDNLRIMDVETISFNSSSSFSESLVTFTVDLSVYYLK